VAKFDQEAQHHDRQPVTDIAEHHPEHEHVCECREQRRVDVAVWDGRVGGDQRSERFADRVVRVSRGGNLTAAARQFGDGTTQR